MKTAALTASMFVASAAPAQTLSLDEAPQMSPAALLARLLGQTGTLMVEAEVDNGAGAFDGRSSLASVRFAGSPRASGWNAICEADRISVRFEPIGSQRSATNPIRIIGVDTSTSFAVPSGLVGKRSSAAEQRRSCSRPGPVLDRWQAPARMGFFSGLVDGRASLRAVDVAFARAGGVAPECGGAHHVQRTCADLFGLYEAPDWSRLAVVTIDACEDQPALRCATLSFELGERLRFETQRVAIELATDAARTDPPPSTLTVRSVRLSEEIIAQ